MKHIPMNALTSILMVTLLFLGVTGAQPTRAEGITVFAAASLKDALEVIAQTQSIPVSFSFAGSGTLARQIAAGAPADVVVLAHSDWMDWLEGQTALIQRRDIAGNRLVLIGPADADDLPMVTLSTLQDRLGDGRLALGQTDSVPAGIYAKAWLTRINAWDALRPQLAETDNVRAALMLVSRGEAPLGVVYRSDALADQNVKKLYLVPSGTHPNIRYPAAALTEKGEAFTKLLSSPAAREILESFGFDRAHRAPE